jgi:hypothetical protein
METSNCAQSASASATAANTVVDFGNGNFMKKCSIHGLTPHFQYPENCLCCDECSIKAFDKYFDDAFNEWFRENNV